MKRKNQTRQNCLSADYLKKYCFSICDEFIGESFVPGDLKYEICDRIHEILLDAYAFGLIKEMPTEIHADYYYNSKTMVIFHGNKKLANWIDDVFNL